MKQFFYIAVFGLAMAGRPCCAHSRDDLHAAMGNPGNSNNVSRTIEVVMNDTLRFTPADIAVKRGETIKFIVKNNGKVKHEMVIGRMTVLTRHAALMRKFPQMEHHDPNQVAIAPGETVEMIWKFTKAGRLDFACLQPGHFEAGMVGKVTVK